MFNAISSIIVVFVLALGGSGITAYAAQDSLPNDLLYPVKLFFEDARYSLTYNSEAKVDLLISFTNKRVDEIVTLTQEGKEVPEGVMENLQTQLQTMLQLAASMDGEGTERALLHIQWNLRTRDQLMTILGQPEEIDPALEQLQAMLENQHRMAEAGLEKPLMFQQMFYDNQGKVTGSPSENADPKKNQNNDCPGLEGCEPEEVEVLDGENPGNTDPSNIDPGNTAPGDTGPGNTDPGSTDPGSTDPGSTDPGSTDPGDPDPGNTDPGNPDPGSGEPGDPDPGNPDPGNPDPGNPDPGDPDPGGGDPGTGSGGRSKP